MYKPLSYISLLENKYHEKEQEEPRKYIYSSPAFAIQNNTSQGPDHQSCQCVSSQHQTHGALTTAQYIININR